MAYEINGIEYPSVTTITGILDKPALLNWASNCAVDHIEEHLDIVRDVTDVHRGEEVLEQARKAYARKRDDAASAGTKVHKAIEQYIDGENPLEGNDPYIDCEEAENGFRAFLQWEEKNHVEWLESEVMVFNVKHGYAGRFDAIAMINGHKYLVDFKTSKAVYDEMYVQLCAYRQAYNEMVDNHEDGFTEKISDVAILHLDKATATPTFHPMYDGFERKTETFNAMVKLYYLLKNRRLKNNPFVMLAKSLDEVVF